MSNHIILYVALFIKADAMSMQTERAKLLEVENLKMYFPIQQGFFRKVVGYVRAVDGISFHIYEGETLGLVGESGCGKTTAGCILRACDTQGQVFEKWEMSSIKHHGN
jgi:peptide/nickel transport system ATP-binding protein